MRQNRLAIALVLFALFFGCTGLAQAARLPTVGGDSDSWGTILNEYLQAEHGPNGTHTNITAQGINVSGDIIAFNTICSAGQVLSTSSDGTLECVTDQTTTSNASANGTENYLAKFSNSSLLTSSIIFENATTGYVGIGTAEPSGKIDVRGGNYLFDATTGNLFVSSTAGGTAGTFLGYGGGLSQVGSTNSAVGLFANNTEKVRITTTGNVGINTTSPQGLLHVVANGNNSLVVNATTGNVGIGTTSPGYPLDVNGRARITGTSGPVGAVGANWYSLSLQNNADANYLEILNSGGAGKGVFFGLNGNNFELWSYQNGNMDFYTGYPTYGIRMRITNTGNVGIGTISPSATFTVNSSNVNGSLLIQNSTNTHLFVNGSSGNMGIGTMGPVTPLDVNGIINTNNGLQARRNGGLQLWSLNSAADAYDVFTTYAGSYSFDIASTPKVVINSSGNVGIGTTEPGAKLDVNGTGHFSGQLTMDGHIVFNSGDQLQLDGGSASAPGLNFGGSSDPDSGLYRLDANRIGLITGGTATKGITIDSNGNVGIGTTTPLAALTVNSSNVNGSLLVQNSTDTHLFVNGTSGNVGIGAAALNAKLDVSGNVNIPAGGYYQWQSGNAKIGETSYNMYFSTWTGSALTEKMRIQGNGNVGIGTTSPLAALTVNSSSINGSLLIQNTTGSTHLFVNGSTGNVGIGTTEPGNILEIQKDQDNQTYLKVINNDATDINSKAGAWYQASTANLLTVAQGAGRTGTRYGLVLANYSEILTTAGNGLLIGTNQAAPVVFGTNNLERMRILDTGDVGIGTTSPVATLTVNSSNGNGSLLIQNTTGSTHLFVNGTSGNVGIGTTEPGRTLSLSGTGIYLYGAAPLVMSSGGQIWWGNGTKRLTGMDGAGLEFLTATTERMRIDDTGNVGIGTASPTQKLDVNGSVNVSGTNSQLWVNGSLVCTLANGLCQAVGSGGGWTNDTATTSTSLDVNAYNASNASQSYLFVNGTSGNVGIGTTSPGYKLTVSQSADNNGIRLYGYDDKASSYFDIFLNSGGNTILTAGNGGLFYSSDVNLFDNKYTAYGASYQQYFQGYDATDGYFRFRSNYVNGAYPNPNVSGDIFRVYDGTDDLIIPFGSVGIGTTGPAAKLHVNATNSTGGSDGTLQDAFLIQNATGSTLLFVNGSSGNVGIGTAAPSQKLEVNGIIQGSSSLQLNSGQITLGIRNSLVDLYYSSGAALSYWNGSAVIQGLVLNNSGNVGIGTGSPSNRLTVVGHGNFTANITVGSPSGSGITLYNETGGAYCVKIVGASLSSTEGACAGGA